jgi:DNA helicase-2/ATP-dependent DNA helicase PcrA
LVDRIIYLVLKGIPAEDIFVATFTEKAANELITRVSSKLLQLNLKVNLNEMYIGTLHSIFLRILEENREFTRIKRNFRLLDQFDQKYMVFRNMKDYLKVEGNELLLGNHTVNRWDKAGDLIYYLSKVTEECLDVEILCNALEEEIKAIGHFYKI